VLHLAEEVASRGLSWWWLTERLLKEAAAVVESSNNEGEIAAKVALANGVFLLDQRTYKVRLRRYHRSLRMFQRRENKTET